MLPTILLLFVAQYLPQSSPGVLNTLVTQTNIKQTICFHGWTATVRPSAAYTNSLKVRQMAAGALKGKPHDYEEDHRVPLELGGSPTSALNLWPEPWAKSYGAHEKDRLENAVHRDVCSDRLTLEAGRKIFLGDWWVEYKRRFEKGNK